MFAYKIHCLLIDGVMSPGSRRGAVPAATVINSVLIQSRSMYRVAEMPFAVMPCYVASILHQSRQHDDFWIKPIVETVLAIVMLVFVDPKNLVPAGKLSGVQGGATGGAYRRIDMELVELRSLGE